MMSKHLIHLDQDGQVILKHFVSEEVLAEFHNEFERLATNNPDRAHGIRGLLKRSPLISNWACSEALRSILPPEMKPVRGILFDKTPEANWKVAWHQDLTIAVSEKQNLSGYGPWSEKDGTPHVQPPADLLESMITLRLHLDDTPASNGALKVIHGTHRFGKISSGALPLHLKMESKVCEAAAGDLLMMKPLLLHASSASTNPVHRRIIHIEYAPSSILHPMLKWAEHAD